MELREALSQISEIHAKVLEGELFRGYRAATMAATGVTALIAAAIQSGLAPPGDAADYATFWVTVAAACAAGCAVDLFARARSAADRRRTLFAVARFLPAAVAGGLLTPIVAGMAAPAPALLPGLWALMFGLGVSASRSYLPRAVDWVVAYYLVAGIALLLGAERQPVPSPWVMGLTFGGGQLALAWVLRRSLERGGRDGG